MTRVSSFAPALRPDCRVLVLGSMPGVASLAAGQYYAHPRNAFWTIAGLVLGFDAAAPYPERMLALHAAGVGLWDVLAACERPKSLDADIVPESAVPNAIAELLAQHGQIVHIALNGSAAATLFERHIAPTLAPAQAAIARTRLPSTSPAHAARTLEQKLAAWRPVLALGRGA